MFRLHKVNECLGFLGFFRRNSVRFFSVLFSFGFALSIITTSCTTANSSNSTNPDSRSAEPTTVKIGYQKAATILSLLKARGTLEEKLGKSKTSVEWFEFPGGIQMMEAMGAGGVDFGYVGEGPPVFAQAAGTPIKYVAREAWGSKAEAIVVHADSPIQNLDDLKGKKIAFNKGGNVHYLLLQALESKGLKYSDVQPTFLPPADARVAFEGRKIDALISWDPFLASIQASTPTRVIADGQGLVGNPGYYLALDSLTSTHPEIVESILEEVEDLNNWAQRNPQEVAKFLSPQLGIDSKVLETAEKRREYGLQPMSKSFVAEQQKVADAFYRLKLIPNQISIENAMWVWQRD